MSGTPVVVVRPVTGDETKTVKIFSDPRNRLCTCISANHLSGFCTLTHAYAGTLTGILKHFESLVGDDKKQRPRTNHSSVLDFCDSLDVKDKKKKTKVQSPHAARKHRSGDGKHGPRRHNNEKEQSDSGSDSDQERR